MLIAVEGMDGVGKTTISQYIAHNYDFTFIEKPLHFFYNDDATTNYADLMQVAKKMYTLADDVVMSWYIALGNIYVARMLKNQNIVVDRHLVSNYYWNGDTSSNPVFEALIKTSGVPDLTILLYATPKTRMERLSKRNKFDTDLTDPDKMDDGYQKMLYFLKKFNLNYLIIDTENKSLLEVEQIIDQELNKLFGFEKKLILKK